MTRVEFFAQWSQAHGGVALNVIVRGWLNISYSIARVLSALRLTPNSITVAGVLAAIALVPTARTWAAPIILIFSLICDGVDGSLAIITGKSTIRGAAWDSIADRISEALWAVAFYRIGAPIEVIFFAWLAAATQEYLRARTAGLGYKQIDFVTVAERPVRAIIMCVALLAYLLELKSVTGLAVVWLVLQSFSFVALARHTYKKITTS